ncbi:hypothetical protein ACJ7V3_10630, partial [Halomonas elongata]|uniref:hypothetical protein n=1 Tax=Halomonas elongata TaxID=2746 RepID=UPI0038D3C21F
RCRPVAQRLARKAYSTESASGVKLVPAESDANLVEATPIEPSVDPVASGEHFTEIGLPVNRRFPKRSEKPQEKQVLLPPYTACNVARRRQRMRTLRISDRRCKPFATRT